MTAGLLMLALLGAEPEAAEVQPDVPHVVMHHAINTREIEFEWPWGGKSEIVFPDWKVQVGSTTVDLSITKHVFWLLLDSLVLAILILVFGRPKPNDEVQKGFSGVLEALVMFVRDTAVSCMGEHDADHYVPYLCTVFCFVLFAGLVGVLPFTATPTANVAVTAALALFTFVLTQIAGMRSQGVVGYWTHLVPGGVPWWLYPVMIPVELLGLFTKPFALTVRLFANMTAGHIVILVLLGLGFIMHNMAWTIGFGAPMALAVYLLELLVIGIQAYIFMVLSATFIGLAGHSH